MYRELINKINDVSALLYDTSELNSGLLEGKSGLGLFEFTFQDLFGRQQKANVLDNIFSQVEQDKNPLNTFCNSYRIRLFLFNFWTYSL